MIAFAVNLEGGVLPNNHAFRTLITPDTDGIVTNVLYLALVCADPTVG